MQLSAESYNACAVDDEGGIVCWPDSLPWKVGGLGYLAPKDEPVKQVSLGAHCACVVYETAQTDCWIFHGRDPTSGVNTSWIERWNPAGVSSVHCGQEHACAILEDGTVECNWTIGGESDGGGADSSDGRDADAPDGHRFIELSCGAWYCCGLRADGTATCGNEGGGPPAGSDMPRDFPGPKSCDARRSNCPVEPTAP